MIDWIEFHCPLDERRFQPVRLVENYSPFLLLVVAGDQPAMQLVAVDESALIGWKK
jgi:hypothetical protein